MPKIRAEALRPGSAWVFLTLGVLATAAVAAVPVTLAPAVFALVAAGSISAVVAGYRLQAVVRRPWRLIATACGLFLGGAVLRAVLPADMMSPDSATVLIPDALTLPGYVVLAAGLLGLLRLRRDQDSSVRLDAVLIGLAAGLAAWTFLMSPTLAAGGDSPALLHVAASVFPAMDVLLTGIVAQLAFSAHTKRAPSLWMLGAGMLALFAGDLLYALHVAGAVPATVLGTCDLLFLLAYVGMGAAALHPSMRVLSESPAVAVRPVGVARVLGIAAALLVPVALVTAFPVRGATDVTVRLTLSTALVVAVALRTVRAVNSHARAVAAAREQATHDPLTGLPNRLLLNERVTTALNTGHARDLTVLFMDLDGFKLVNDSWGHGVGDELLIAVAARLRASVREQDFVCRVGGDEFVVVMAGQAPETLAPQVVQRILDEFAKPFQLSVGPVVVTASIGITSAEPAATSEELVRDADIAMYKAKVSGRNGYAFFDESLRAQVQSRAELEQALRGAVDRGEMEVYYQPIIDLGTDELTGYEALLRWNHPDRGQISPAEFIPVAEETGIIVPLGAWVLREATRQVASWQADLVGVRKLHVSVNVAARQLQHAGFVGEVVDALVTSGLPSDALWLEITESAMMDDPEAAGATLERLAGLGVLLAVDDFGTGYSALGYLKRFPVGVVKIDRSFVSGLGQDSDADEIVRAVVAMSHAIGLGVVAEGVETSLQRDRLRELGCDYVQGYLYGRPRSASATLSGHDRWLAGAS